MKYCVFFVGWNCFKFATRIYNIYFPSLLTCLVVYLYGFSGNCYTLAHFRNVSEVVHIVFLDNQFICIELLVIPSERISVSLPDLGK